MTSTFKKDFYGSKKTYCPVSILPIISKTFDKLQCKQRINFTEELVSKF